MTISVEDMHFRYHGDPLLQGIDLEVEPGESVFLLGPSGAGKSTILRCIAGLERPDEGRVLFNREDITFWPVHRRRIGMMFQEPALFPHLDVRHNVMFGLKYRWDDVDDMQVEADRFLAMVGVLDKARSRVDELSGGQRQRVALARALAAKPHAVLLDEPLSALDRTLRESLGQRIKEVLRKAKVPALWVTHDEEEVGRLADKAFDLVDGRLERRL